MQLTTTTIINDEEVGVIVEYEYYKEHWEIEEMWGGFQEELKPEHVEIRSVKIIHYNVEQLEEECLKEARRMSDDL